ncbi:uncharacterized protein [Malus domestica]|uniref:uncharacterized protein isoform X1 n=1 Tax=Malus domestica TaxID=3750 RepID=UPI003974712B
MESWKREAEIWKVWLILCKFNIRQVYNRRISNSKISNAVVGVDRKDLMRKLSKFIYEEEKALELSHREYIWGPTIPVLSFQCAVERQGSVNRSKFRIFVWPPLTKCVDAQNPMDLGPT